MWRKYFLLIREIVSSEFYFPSKYLLSFCHPSVPVCYPSGILFGFQPSAILPQLSDFLNIVLDNKTKCWLQTSDGGFWNLLINLIILDYFNLTSALRKTLRLLPLEPKEECSTAEDIHLLLLPLDNPIIGCSTYIYVHILIIC